MQYSQENFNKHRKNIWQTRYYFTIKALNKVRNRREIPQSDKGTYEKFTANIKLKWWKVEIFPLKIRKKDKSDHLQHSIGSSRQGI